MNLGNPMGTDQWYVGQLLTHDEARSLIDTLSIPMWRWYKNWRFNHGHVVDLTPTVAVVRLERDAVIFNTV